MTEEFKASMLKAMQPLEGWCWPEKACVMADIVIEHKPDICVETGVFGGKSAIPIAMALREVGNLGVLWAIDPWSKSAALEGLQGVEHIEWWSNVDLEGIYYGFVRSTLALELGYHLRWLRTTSRQASDMFPDRCVDFFHQDSNHSEEVSCAEAKLWAPKLKRKAFWIFDDADWRSTQQAMKLIESYGFKAVNDDEKYRVFQRT